MITDDFKLEELEEAIENARRAHNNNPSKLTAKALSTAYSAHISYSNYLQCQSEIKYMADHIHELDEADFTLPFDYSTTIDPKVVALCEEFDV